MTLGRDLAVIGFRAESRAKFPQSMLICFGMSLHDLGVELGETLLAAMPAHGQFYPKGARSRIWPLQPVPAESDAFRLSA